MEFLSELIKRAGHNKRAGWNFSSIKKYNKVNNSEKTKKQWEFCEKYGKIYEQGGKMLKIIKRAGSNKSEQGGKNLENS